MESPKNIGLVLLPRTTLMRWNYLLPSVAKEGKDGSGLKLGKIGQIFQVLKLYLENEKNV